MIDIGIDVDGVLRDFTGKLQKEYKKTFPDHETKEIQSWGLENFFPIGKEIYQFVSKNQKEIFTNAEPYDGAVRFIESLSDMEHVRLIIVSAPWSASAIPFNVEWLNNHFDPAWFHGQFFVKDKSLFSGNILLDDGIHNLEKVNRKTLPICFSQPWNKDWEGIRVSNYYDFLKIIEKQ